MMDLRDSRSEGSLRAAESGEAGARSMKSGSKGYISPT